MPGSGDLFFRAGRLLGRIAHQSGRHWRATRTAFRQGLEGEAAPSPADAAKLAELYSQLDLPLGANLDAVDQAWKRLLRRHHPDRFANDPEGVRRATERTQALNHARAELRRRLGTS